MLDLLTAVRRVNDGVTISFDPGHEWAVSGSPAVAGIARLSNVLLLNEVEFRALAGGKPGDSDEAVAASLFDRLGRPGVVAIVKRSYGAESFRREGSEVTVDRQAQVPLTAAEIEDSTGAGDVFAAGVLAVLASGSLTTAMGCLLGLRLARHKLGYLGACGHETLAQIAQNFISGQEATSDDFATETVQDTPAMLRHP